MARTRFYRSRSILQGQSSNQGHTMMQHTYNPQPMLLPGNNFLHLTVFLDIAQTRFYMSRSLRHGQMSNQCHMGNWVQWQVEWLVVVVGTHEVIVHHDQGVVQGEVQRKLRVPNLRSKVLVVVGSLVQSVTPHVQEEEAVSAQSNLHCDPPIRHSLVTNCPHLCPRGRANLQAPELLVHTLLWLVLSRCLGQNCEPVVGHWDHRSEA